MNVLALIFVINVVALLGIAIYRLAKKQTKALIINLAILSIFVLVKAVEINYETIRAGLFAFLGEEMFESLRLVLSMVVFYGTSISVGVQLIASLISIILFVALAVKAAKLIVWACAKKLFEYSITQKNERVVDKGNRFVYKTFLVFGKLIN